MPVFQFVCNKCGLQFSELIPYTKKNQVLCPTCKSVDLSEDYRGYGSSPRVKASKASGSKFT